MCGFGLAAGIGLGVLSLGTGIYSAVEQANAVSAYNNRAMDMARMQSMMTMSMSQSQYALTMQQLQQSEQFATKASTMQMEMLEQQADQVQGQAALDTLERIRQGMRDRAKARVAAAEAGVGGTTPDRIESNVLFQQGYDTALIDENRQNNIQQIKANVEGVGMDLRGKLMDIGSSRVNATVSRDNAFLEAMALPLGVEKKTAPNPFLSGLSSLGSAISTGLSTYGAVKNMNFGPKTGSSLLGKYNVPSWS